MQKVCTIIIIVVTLLSSPFTLDTTNDLVQDNYIEELGWAVEPAESGSIDIEEITEILSNIRFEFKEPYVIHILDYIPKRPDAILGVVLSDTEVVLFNYLPEELSYIYKNTLMHELGHLVYRGLTDEQRDQYRQLREIPSEWDDSSRTNYLNRPTEIFAEDFRIMFSPFPDASPYHPNELLGDPMDNRELRRFMRNIPETYKHEKVKIL